MADTKLGRHLQASSLTSSLRWSVMILQRRATVCSTQGLQSSLSCSMKTFNMEMATSASSVSKVLIIPSPLSSLSSSSDSLGFCTRDSSLLMTFWTRANREGRILSRQAASSLPQTRQRRCQPARMQVFWGSVCSKLDSWMWIMMLTSFSTAGLNFSAPTELAMMVRVSMACPLSCLYSLVVWVSMMLKRSPALASKYLSKCFSQTSATEEMVLRQLSLTREMPLVECLMSSSMRMSTWEAILGYFIPSKKLVRAAAAWETTRGTSSLSRETNLGYSSSPQTSWNLGCISSEIWPTAWQAAYLIMGLLWCRNPAIISTMELIIVTSSMYSPTCERAMMAVYLYLQSSLTRRDLIPSERMGSTSLSPTEQMILSMAPIPKRVVSKSSSSSMSSLQPSSGLFHSSLMFWSMSIMWTNNISRMLLRYSLFLRKVAGDFSAQSTRISVACLLTPLSTPGILKMLLSSKFSSLKFCLKNLCSMSSISDRVSSPSSFLSWARMLYTAWQMSSTSDLKGFWSFTSVICRKEEKALRAASWSLGLELLNPFWNSTNRSCLLSLNTSGAKGRKVSKTLKADKIDPSPSCLKSSHRDILNSGQWPPSRLSTEPATSPRVSAMCFFMEALGSLKRIWKSWVLMRAWTSGVRLGHRLVQEAGQNSERQSLS